MATIDAEAYFTNGLCVPSGGLDGVSYSTLGLVLGSGTTPVIVPGGGLDEYPAIMTRDMRRRAVREAQDEADLLLMVLLAIEAIEDDG